ncbi:alcohol dehydrogenase catalytic domain-containing protein [Streptomyces sp. NEAU-H3]|nr:alcohol dehydrogenase catalytic domain-containing protein [Streptomyces sp. NEAU-H3]
MESAGICRTDLEILGGALEFPLPFVAGHEGAGTVVAIGSDVTTVEPGDTVALGAAACGTCARCRTGAYPYCDNHVARNFTGARLDGGTGLRRLAGKTIHGHLMCQSSWADLALAHTSNTVKVPSSTPRCWGPSAAESRPEPAPCGTPWPSNPEARSSSWASAQWARPRSWRPRSPESPPSSPSATAGPSSTAHWSWEPPTPSAHATATSPTSCAKQQAAASSTPSKPPGKPTS